MAMVTASAHFSPKPSSPLPRTSAFPGIPTASSRCFFPSALGPAILPSRRRALCCPVIKTKISQDVDRVEEAEQQQIQVQKPNETLLYSNLLPLLFLAALPGGTNILLFFSTVGGLITSLFLWHSWVNLPHDTRIYIYRHTYTLPIRNCISFTCICCWRLGFGAIIHDRDDTDSLRS